MKKYQTSDINEVQKALLSGEIIAFPTDTVFGLACVFDDMTAIKKVYAAKSRESKKALPMMCGNTKMIEEVAFVSEDAKKIMKAFMPGAITIIYKKKNVIDDYVTSNLPTIGIRIPDDKWIIELIEKVGKPLLVTSANISGEPSLFKWEDVYKELDGKIDGVVMSDARGDSSSTIVDCSSEEIKVLRKGPISIEQIMQVLKNK